MIHRHSLMIHIRNAVFLAAITLVSGCSRQLIQSDPIPDKQASVWRVAQLNSDSASDKNMRMLGTVGYNGVLVNDDVENAGQVSALLDSLNLALFTVFGLNSEPATDKAWAETKTTDKRKLLNMLKKWHPAGMVFSMPSEVKQPDALIDWFDDMTACVQISRPDMFLWVKLEAAQPVLMQKLTESGAADLMLIPGLESRESTELGCVYDTIPIDEALQTHHQIVTNPLEGRRRYAAESTAPVLSARSIFKRSVMLSFDSTFANASGPVTIQSKEWMLRQQTDVDGFLYTVLPALPDTLVLMRNGLKRVYDCQLWRPPYQYKCFEDGSVDKEGFWLEYRKGPMTDHKTDEAHVLFKAPYPADVSINGRTVKQYKTGIFFDTLKLQYGDNFLSAAATDSAGQQASLAFIIHHPKPEQQRGKPRLWINKGTAEPLADRVVGSDDRIRVSFTGSRGQSALLRLKPGGKTIALNREDYKGYSRYSADVPAMLLKEGKWTELTVEMNAQEKVRFESSRLKHSFKARIKRINDSQFPFVRIKDNNTLIQYNEGQIRLGGPLISESMQGAVARVCGEKGSDYVIQLDGMTQGLVSKDGVEVLPSSWSKPGFFIRSVHVSPGKRADVVAIPYSEPVPYAVFPEPDQKRIRVALYGAKTTSTWITHKDSLSSISRVTWQQTLPETYEVLVYLPDEWCWGYELKRVGTSLRLSVRHAPEMQSDSTGMILKGLHVAIEAGHGGRNFGAQGLSGLLEKDVNLDVAQRLEQLCLEAGMTVTQARPDDRYMYLNEKRDIITNADPDIMVSIHANAGSGRGGFLRTDGVSTYYNNPFWAPYAETMYRSLRRLPLNDYGVVGSFNYKVIRITECPAILVEQGFMDHAEDEEKLADPDFRQRMAEQIFEGLRETLTGQSRPGEIVAGPVAAESDSDIK